MRSKTEGAYDNAWYCHKLDITQPTHKPSILEGGFGYNPSVAYSDSSLYTREPTGGNAVLATVTHASGGRVV